MTGNHDDGQSESTEVSEYSFHGLPHSVPHSVPHPPPRNDVSPSPNQVRRSKRQPMADLSSSTQRSTTPSPLPSSSSSISRPPRDLNGERNASGAGSQEPLAATSSSLSSSLNSSPTHVPRSPRMGRKSLRSYQQIHRSAPPPAPHYENQTYPPVEHLYLNDPHPYSAPASASALASAPAAEPQEVTKADPVAAVQEIALQTEDLLLPANNSINDVDINLEEILASVTAGGAPPVLTKQVLDKLLAAAAAKLSAVRNHPPEEVRSSLPNLSQVPLEETSSCSSRPSSNSDSSPTDPSLPDAGCPPRKSNLSGKVKGQGQGQLSVRFDPKQVGTRLNWSFNEFLIQIRLGLIAGAVEWNSFDPGNTWEQQQQQQRQQWTQGPRFGPGVVVVVDVFIVQEPPETSPWQPTPLPVLFRKIRSLLIIGCNSACWEWLYWTWLFIYATGLVESMNVAGTGNVAGASAEAEGQRSRNRHRPVNDFDMVSICSTCSSSSSDEEDDYSYHLPSRRAYGGVRISYVPNDAVALASSRHRASTLQPQTRSEKEKDKNCIIS